MSDPRAVLDLIDDVLADWECPTSEPGPDAMRWTPGANPRPLEAPLDPEAVRDAIRRLGVAWAAAGEELRRGLAAMTRGFADLGSQLSALSAAFGQDPATSSDPRDRALAAARSRHTGPALAKPGHHRSPHVWSTPMRGR